MKIKITPQPILMILIMFLLTLKVINIRSLQNKLKLKLENSDVMFLRDVVAFIYIKDSDTIKITSNFGKYNSKNYDTIFSENVIVIYPGHKITGEYLDFSFLSNLGTFTENVIYTGEKTNLFADKIEMNLTTKDTKIFMNDAGKKVVIFVEELNNMGIIKKFRIKSFKNLSP